MTQFLLNHCLLKPVNECLKDEDSNKNNYDKISGSFVKNKANNRQIFLQVLQSVQFFCCQDLAFRSKNGDGKRSSHWRCSIKKVFLETSQNSLEDTCATAFCFARPVKIFVDYLLYFSQSYQKFYRTHF